MSKPQQDVLKKFVPFPSGGLNLISGPMEAAENEARQLDNYLVFDSGIRQISPPVKNMTVTSGSNVYAMFPYITDAGVARMLFCSNNKIWRLDNPTDSTKTDVTNGTAITSNQWNICFFNKTIFFFNGRDTPRTHDRGVGNVADFGGTGPTIANLIQAQPYKHRLYAVEKDSTKVWYGGVDAITGAFTSFDFGSVFESSGNLHCVFGASFNAGIQNEEYFCALNTEGELLVYSGDYPSNPNWELVARGRVPKINTIPITRQPFLKTGNETYLATTRGLITLSSVISAGVTDKPLYTLSRKIKDAANLAVGPVLSPLTPFIFVAGYSGSSTGNLYAFNHELSAWSRITTSTFLASNDYIASMCMFSGYLMFGCANAPDLYHIDLNSTGYADSTLTYTWKTPFYQFGKPLQKRLIDVRVLGRNYGAASTFKNIAYCATEFQDPASPSTSTGSTSVAADVNTIQTLCPPGFGENLSIAFSRAGVSSISERNEIQGFWATYELGGLQ